MASILSRARRQPMMWLLALIGALLLGVIARGLVEQGAYPEIVVYKSPTCGCCNAWVEHLRAHGFVVRTYDVRDLGRVRRDHAVPARLESCHTATIGGYVIEGHVPAADLKRLLDERPDVAGLAVPGMPIGSPGMEQGSRRERYDVLAFDSAGAAKVFAEHR